MSTWRTEPVSFGNSRHVCGPWTVWRKPGNSVVDIFYGRERDGSLTMAQHRGYAGSLDDAKQLCEGHL